MKTCRRCGEELSNKEFNKNIYGEYLDICKECEAEENMDDEEREGWEEIQKSYDD